MKTIASILVTAGLAFTVARYWPARYVFVGAGQSLYRCNLVTGHVDREAGMRFVSVDEPAPTASPVTELPH